MAREVPCPRCGTRREWSGNAWRPFCSERCKVIDLGGWFSEKNAIPGEAVEIPDGEGDAHLQRNDRSN
jgi:endogenous inhibitor of DNA gyrase (YacG/DUF329 family)